MAISTLFRIPWSYLPSLMNVLAAWFTDMFMAASLWVVPTMRLTLGDQAVVVAGVVVDQGAPGGFHATHAPAGLGRDRHPDVRCW